MVKRLTEDELKYEIENNEHWVKLNLHQKSIEEWIQDGRFVHLKKELMQYQNLSFGCLKDDGICRYYFVSDNDVAIKRITNLLSHLIDGKKMSIIKLSNKKVITYNITYTGNTGDFNACPLF